MVSPPFKKQVALYARARVSRAKATCFLKAFSSGVLLLAMFPIAPRSARTTRAEPLTDFHCAGSSGRSVCWHTDGAPKNDRHEWALSSFFFWRLKNET